MEINRDSLCAGLLTKASFLTLSYPRKVLFSYDMVSQTGYDVINKKDFVVHKRGNGKHSYISCVKPLGKALEALGYPEMLEDVHLERIMGEDFGKIFVESAIMHDLYSQSMEKLTDLSFADNFASLKHDFQKSRDEKMEDDKKKQKARKKGWV